jgi:hypothetical protein
MSYKAPNPESISDAFRPSLCEAVEISGSNPLVRRQAITESMSTEENITSLPRVKGR